MIEICGLATASPPLLLSQEESLAFIRANFKVRPETIKLYERVFRNESVEARRFCLEKIEDVLEEDPDKINRRFEQQAVQLSARSLKNALSRASMQPAELDFLAVSTCTGYLCPGLASQLIGPCGLRKDLRYVEVVGMGCGGAIPSLEQCHNFLKANPNSAAAAVSTEICSSAIYSDDAPDLVISNALFADGSAAAVLKNLPNRSIASLQMFASLSVPEWKESLRFTTENGRLRNKLAKEVPVQTGLSVRNTVHDLCKNAGLDISQIQYWIFHTGGKKVLDEIQKSLNLPNRALEPARKILKQYGNLSSPSVLYVLEETLNSFAPKQGDWGLIVSFGAGFSVHVCLIKF